MESSDYKLASDFIEQISLSLMDIENKAYANTRFSIDNFKTLKANGRTFYVIYCNTFKQIVEHLLLRVCHEKPQYFGTKNANDVLWAFFEENPLGDFEWYKEFLRNEEFCYVIENVKGVIQDKILRIDLFRQLKIDKKNNLEFIGGLLHCLKHFSFNDKPLSTHKANHNINSIESLLIQIALVFFNYEIKNCIGNDKYLLEIKHEEMEIRFIYYKEAKSNVYFINSIYRNK